MTRSHRYSDDRVPPPPRNPGPPPVRPQPRPQVTVARDGAGMAALRTITYVLASTASALFIALVIYGYVQLQQMQTAVENLFGGTGAVPTFELPPYELPPTPTP